MAGFQFVSPDIAVDIGTDNTRVYVKDKGIVVNEPSVVITRGEGPRNIVAVGDSADEMIGRAGRKYPHYSPLERRRDRRLRDGADHGSLLRQQGDWNAALCASARGGDHAGRRQQGRAARGDQHDGKNRRAADFRG